MAKWAALWSTWLGAAIQKLVSDREVLGSRQQSTLFRDSVAAAVIRPLQANDEPS
jgi:hypothetical protein